MKRVSNHMTRNARRLRRTATPAERMLWNILAPYRPRFTRQFPVGGFIVDIACRQAKLAVELDGGQHGERLASDTERTQLLEAQGWMVLRVWNNELLADPQAVAEVILRKVHERTGVEPFLSERRRVVEE